MSVLQVNEDKPLKTLGPQAVKVDITISERFVLPIDDRAGLRATTSTPT